MTFTVPVKVRSSSMGYGKFANACATQFAVRLIVSGNCMSRLSTANLNWLFSKLHVTEFDFLDFE